MAFMQARKGGSSKLWFAEVSGGLLHCDYYVVFCPIVGGAY